MVKVVFHIECETAPGEVVAPGTFNELRGALFLPPPTPQQPPLLPPPPSGIRALVPSANAIALLPPSAKPQHPASGSAQPVKPALKKQADQKQAGEIEDRRSTWSPILIGGCVGFLFLFLLLRHGPKVIPFMARRSSTPIVESTATDPTATESTTDSTATEPAPATSRAPKGETVILDSPNPAAGKHPKFPNTTPDAALGEN